MAKISYHYLVDTFGSPDQLLDPVWYAWQSFKFFGYPVSQYNLSSGSSGQVY